MFWRQPGQRRSYGAPPLSSPDLHADASDALATRITAHITDVAQQLELLDVSVSASTGVIGRSIDATKAQLNAFMQEVQSGTPAAHQLITHAESLLLAHDAVTRGLDETLPRALDRMKAHGKTTQSALAQLRPMLDASELVAQSTMSHVNAVQATLKANEEQMAGHATSQQELVDRINGSLADAEAAAPRGAGNDGNTVLELHMAGLARETGRLNRARRCQDRQ